MSIESLSSFSSSSASSSSSSSSSTTSSLASSPVDVKVNPYRQDSDCLMDLLRCEIDFSKTVILDFSKLKRRPRPQAQFSSNSINRFIELKPVAQQLQHQHQQPVAKRLKSLKNKFNKSSQRKAATSKPTNKASFDLDVICEEDSSSLSISALSSTSSQDTFSDDSSIDNGFSSSSSNSTSTNNKPSDQSSSSSLSTTNNSSSSFSTSSAEFVDWFSETIYIINQVNRTTLFDEHHNHHYYHHHHHQQQQQSTVEEEFENVYCYEHSDTLLED